MNDPKTEETLLVVSPEPFGEYVQPAPEIRQASIPPDVSGHVSPVVIKIPDDVGKLGVSSSTNPSIGAFSGVILPGAKLKDASPDTGSAWMKKGAIHQEDMRRVA